ncbi:hypothetical protein BC834DRAFT_437503 [Gloeopeniophorella convolvens]|nr:hypothetical protein BC834DRAFT_437503 [Gloeopeniophorella convolvens]
MLWRVGRGTTTRQSLHQLARSLADLLSPSSHHLSPIRPPLPLTCLRSLALTRPKPRPAHASPDSYDTVSLETPSSGPAQAPTPCQRTTSIHELPLELLSLIDSPQFRVAESRTIRKELGNVPGNHDLLRIFSDSRKVSRLAQHLTHSSHPHRALFILAVAHRSGCALGREVYESLAHRLAEAREWNLIPPLVALQKHQSGRHTARLLDWQVRALVEMSHFSRLDRALEWFEAEGVLPTRRTYHTLLCGHIRNRNIAKAMEIIQRMLAAGFPVDSETQAVVVSAYRTLGPDAIVQTRALDALKDADAKSSTRILNALLQSSIDTQDTERVALLLLHFNFGTFDTSLLLPGGHLRRREGDGAALSELIRSSSQSRISSQIPPDVATYTILLHYMASRRDLPSSLGLLRQMECSTLVPDHRFVAALIRLYFATGRPDAAVHLASVLCAGIEGSQAIFKGLNMRFDPNEEIPILRALPKPAIEILNALATGLLRLRGLDGLHACLRLMQMCQIIPDSHTAALLESYLIHVEGLPSAEVDRVMKEFPTNVSSLPHLFRLLDSLLRSEFRGVRRSGWNRTASVKASPSQSPSPAPFLTGWPFDPAAGIHPMLSRNASRAPPVAQSLADRGVLADRWMFALRIRHEAVTKGDMAAAKDIFQTMLDRGLHPNEYHYAALMEGYIAAGDLAAAEAVINAAERGGIKPNCVMYTILIVGHARDKDPWRAMRVLQHMVAAGVRPDIAAVDAITSAFFAVGSYRAARQTLLNLWSSVAPLPRGFEGTSLKMLLHHLRNLQSDIFSPRKLTHRERRALLAKLKELVQTWLSTDRARADSHQDTMYAKHLATPRRRISPSHSP